MKSFLLIFLLLICIGLPAQNFVFKNGSNGYAYFRIPAIVKTNSGKLLAFAEGRKMNAADSGDIDLVMKSSTDKGLTWGPLKKIWDSTANTCGNPSPVVDMATGQVLVIATLNNNRVFMLRSIDEGENWLQPTDITPAVKLTNWTWYATGPGHALQCGLSGGKKRIVVACNHTLRGNNVNIAHTIYSDDAGATWHLGGIVPSIKTDEGTMAQLPNGNLILNMRSDDRKLPNRKVSISKDFGLSWSEAVYDTALIDPACAGALLKYSFDSSLLLFSNSKSPFLRKKLTISISSDYGKTWPIEVIIEPNESAYSDMVELSDGYVIVLYEVGKPFPNIGISASIVSPSQMISPLVSIKTEKANENIELFWTTAREKHIDRFEIERSMDGVRFETIGVVISKGNSPGRLEYGFNDQGAARRYTSKIALFYRLKLVHLDGSESYSSVKQVDLNNLVNFSVTALPVPFHDALSISVNSVVQARAAIIVYDMFGRKAFAGAMVLLPGPNTATFREAGKVSRGIYMVVVDIEGQEYSVKIMK